MSGGARVSPMLLRCRRGVGVLFPKTTQDNFFFGSHSSQRELKSVLFSKQFAENLRMVALISAVREVFTKKCRSSFHNFSQFLHLGKMWYLEKL